MTPQSNVMLFCSGYCQFAASMHVCELCACALWCKCGRERERETERQRERRRSVLCARLPVTLWRWHTLLLDRWLGYSAGLAASSQERMEALCGRMSWTLWKGRSSQTGGGGEKRKKRRRRREGGCINWRGGAPGGEGWQNNIHTRAPRPSRSPLSPRQLWAAVCWLFGWCPGSNAAANGRPEETDICICSRGMRSYPSPVYKDWAVPPDLSSCPRLSVSLTKRFTPARFFLPGLFYAHTNCILLPLCLSLWILYGRCALRYALAGM